MKRGNGAGDLADQHQTFLAQRRSGCEARSFLGRARLTSANCRFDNNC
jgi:hypothetical protein